ncbi:MAG: DUF4097 family beta strand repeat protein [Acidobacteria bacterium]|nr:DUF4097 family beta strand repeat protein [Acidobacteriota bacterium]
MSSPGPLIPPPPPMPPRPPRSIAGPVVLIAIGVLFLLGTMGVLQWHHLGYWFAHYWPVLLIVAGIIKLLEYQQAQRSGIRPRGIGAGGIFLIILLITFGLIATQASRVDWDSLRDHIQVGDDDFPFFGHTYNYEDQIAQDFPAGNSLHVVNDRGAVNLSVSQDNQIHVAVHKRINADKQEQADEWNPKTKPEITVSGQTVTVNANTQGAGDHSVTSDLDISVPRKAAVVIAARRGDVSVLGRDGDVDVSSQKGDITVSDVNGKVALKLQNSSARVSQISSDVSVEGRPSDVSVEEVKGALRMNGEFDSLRLGKIGGRVTFKSTRTDLELAKLPGDLDMDAGDFRASDVTGPFRLLTRSKDIRVNGVSGDVRLQNENGAVEVHVTKVGDLQLENRRGDIELYLPDKATFQLEAKARDGDIASEFPGVKVNNSDDQATAMGGNGSGGPKIVLSNDRGSISIQKGSSFTEEQSRTVPAPPNPPTPKKLPSPPSPPEPTDN